MRGKSKNACIYSYKGTGVHDTSSHMDFKLLSRADLGEALSLFSRMLDELD